MRPGVVPADVIAALLAEIDAAGVAAAPPAAAAPTAVTGNGRAGGRRAKARAAAGAARRCRAYVGQMDPAAEGDHGSDQTFKAARVIWNDFGLDEAAGWPILCAFNARCTPPWPLEHDEGGKQCLRRKWDEAVRKGPCPKGRGWRLADDGDAGPPRGAGGGSPPRPAPPGAGGGPPGLPQILISERQYREVEDDALRALVAANDPPRVFVGNGGALVDLQRPDPARPPRGRVLDGPKLRPILARVADWFKLESDGDGGKRTVPEFPPHAVLTSFPERGDWPGVPRLRCVVTFPVFAPDWELLAAPGYHPGAGIYCHLDGLDLPPVPDRPSAGDVAAAKELILTDLLGDFPFVDDASRAHAVAMLLLPLVRHTIDGPTPLAVADAPVEGTGKSLLVEASMLVTLGEVPEAITADLKEEERDKTLMALLVEGHPVIFFDNANHKLDSASFANTLTARRKRGRILGFTQTADAEVNVCWVLTGNNFTCSREIARRLYWCRIDAGVETPSERQAFRHPDLLAWVRTNRGRLLWALVVLVRHWRATGAVPGTKTLGKYERWAKTVGGVLEAASIPGFLDNAAAFRKQCADQAGEMAEFVRRWWDRHQDARVITADLFDLAKESLETVLTAENEEGKRKQLGKFLKKNRDRVVGGYRIRVPLGADGGEDKDYAGRARFRLEPARKADGGRSDHPPEGEFEMSV